MGIAGNLTCHPGTAGRLVQAAAFRDAVFRHAALRDDAACLSEVCRLLSGVLRQQIDEQWLGSMLCDAMLDRLGWILSNTLNSTLLERQACDTAMHCLNTSWCVAQTVVLHAPVFVTMVSCMHRACTLFADLAGAGERAVRALLERKLPDQAAACLEQHLQSCYASKAEAGAAAGWDGAAGEGGRDDPCFPSLAAVDAALDALEVGAYRC